MVIKYDVKYILYSTLPFCRSVSTAKWTCTKVHRTIMPGSPAGGSGHKWSVHGSRGTVPPGARLCMPGTGMTVQLNDWKLLLPNCILSLGWQQCWLVLLQLAKLKPCIGELLQYAEPAPVTYRRLLELFEANFHEEGSNRRAAEERMYEAFVSYVRQAAGKCLTFFATYCCVVLKQ